MENNCFPRTLKFKMMQIRVLCLHSVRANRRQANADVELVLEDVDA
jgi:hypothetical protein